MIAKSKERFTVHIPIFCKNRRAFVVSVYGYIRKTPLEEAIGILVPERPTTKKETIKMAKQIQSILQRESWEL